MKEAIEIILGNKSIGYYLAGLFFTCLGILISLYHSSKRRDPHSTSTPYNFSWRFLIWDNTKRIVVSLIVVFLIFRGFELPNVFSQVAVGIVITIALDKVVEWLMEKSDLICDLLGMDRKKFMQKHNR